MAIDIERMLRSWGRAYGEEAAFDGDEGPSATTHPIAIAMQFAPGKKARRLDVARRRMIMAGERVWSRDPIPCTETRTGGRTQLDSTSPAERIQAAVLQLRKVDEARALVITAQYCKQGTQHQKAEWVSAQGHRMAVRTYRERLASARGWVEAKIAA